MKNKVGRKILKNYRGDLSITSENCEVVVTDSLGNRINPGRRKLKIGEHTINVLPITGYKINKLLLNNKSISNNSINNLNFSYNFLIDAKAVEFKFTSPSLFTFNNTELVSYIGSDPDITIPVSYSLGTVSRELEGICYIKDPDTWSYNISSRWSYINSMTFSDGNIVKTYTNYTDMSSGIRYDFSNWSAVYLTNINFNSAYGRTIFSTSTSYNLFDYPIAFNYKNKLYTYNTYSSADTTSGTAKTLSKFFTEVYDLNTDLIGVLHTVEKEMPVEGDDVAVLSIASRAFIDNTIIENVVVQEGLTTIGVYAFRGCTSLRNLSIPSTVNFIGSLALLGSFNLESLSVAPNNEVYSDADGSNCIIDLATSTLMYGCKNTTIPESVINIGERAFQGNKLITSITIPNNIKHVAETVFYGCSNLEEIEFEGVETIGKSVLSQCDKLKSIIFNEGLTAIGGYCIQSCDSLLEIIFPSTLISMGSSMFSGSDNLTKIIMNSNSVPTLAGDLNISSNCKIYVKDSLYSSYRSAQYWSNVASQIYRMSSL